MKWMIVLITWYAATATAPGIEPKPGIHIKRQEIEVAMTQSKCEEYVTRVYEMKGWMSDPKYGFAINCQLNPHYHPKGERK